MSDDFDLNDIPDIEQEQPPRRPPEDAYLADLNPEQRQAVETLDGPVLVLAGAGTGKTRVLTTRLVHLLATQRARPWDILAVTFTNKAAREMAERVGGLIGPAVEGLRWLGTFHAMGARILRRHAELVGLKPNFTILDTDDQIRLIKQLLQAERIDDKRWPARALAVMIDRWKNRGLTPAKVPEDEAFGFAEGRGAELYEQYQARLRSLNATDFGDLLLLCLQLFRKNPEILAEYQQRFRYILVDEYQDTNVAQYLWLRLLAQKHRNICCVGDDDQSIYGWRGAEVGNILRFEEDFPGAKIVRLERNYRSTANILGAASGLIAANEGRLGKTLWTDEENKGEKVTVRGVWDGEEEARQIGDEIEALQRQGHSLNEMAVLVRAGFQTRAFEERLITIGVPYRVIGGLRFYERLEIRDAMAYLRVINQPDDDLAFERIVNTPKRGLGDVTVQALHRLARAEQIPMTQAARQILGTDELRPQARNSLGGLLESFDRWRAQAQELPHTELAEIVLDESGLTDMWRADKSPEAPGRLENLQELVRSMDAYESLPAFLDHVSLVMENAGNDDEDKVNLMTLHGAKGLEFDTVFLPGWEEGLFPHDLALDESGQAGLEEERRLAYVGLTRAKKRAYILHAASRRIYGEWQVSQPSRFIDELPGAHVEMIAMPRMNAGGGRGYGYGHRGDTAVWRNRARGTAPRLEDSQSPAAGSSDFQKGERIFHQKFGYGTIRKIDGSKLDIDFEKAGPKRVMDSFVERP